MNLIMIFATMAIPASENRIEEITPHKVAIEVEEIEPQFEQEKEELAVVAQNPEIEPVSSLDSSIDRKMASILQNEETKEEEFDPVDPQVEDLSHLAKRPSVTIAQDGPVKIESAYENLPVSVTEKQKISMILTTMAENNVFKLLFEKKQLEKLGREINHVHPIRFLGAVFSDPRLVHCMFEIRRSGFKWDGFIDGFSKRFKEEIQSGNVRPYIPGFAASLDLKSDDIIVYINYKDFEGLVVYLMEKSRQK